nr:uncharacterized protein LOC128685269 [Cherax quadricarinatus]
MNILNLPDGSVAPLSRAPNTTFPYNCVGDLMMAKKVDGTESPAGEVTCLPGSNGSQPEWDTQFPCALVCPSDFIMSKNRKSCYYFSTTRASMGHTDALTRRDGTIFPDIGSFQSHGFKCDLQYLYCPGRENGHETCVILNKGGHLNLTECYSAQYYACMRPGSCPPGYTLYNSRCYKVINKSPFSNFLDALDTCNYDGAALAYPQDIDTLNYLVTFAQSNMTGSTPTTMNFAIGFTNIWHDLTINNIYEPSNDVVAAVQSLNRSANSNCTFLSVTNSDQWVLTPASINTTFTYAICEFRGPLGCWDDTPYYENFSVNGNLPGNTVNQRLNYSCWPGYYVNGVVGSEWSQYLWCYGQLGGWFPRQPPLDPCIGIDVCNETFPPAPPGIVMTPDTNPRYKTHKLNYNCAANGMSNLVGQSSQKLVCTKYNESYYNYVGPNITECQRCLNINLLNANTTSLSTDVWTIGEQVTVTCNYSYQVSHNVSTQEITCTNNGWQFLPCQKVCLEVPEVRNATTDWRDKMWRVNDNVTATCLGNLYFALLKSQTRKVLCTDNGWDNSTGCDEVCLDNAVVANATVDLQGKYWLVGSTVPAVCNASHMFLQEENNTVPIMCTSLGWENRTGCALVCEGKPNLQQANTDWNSTGIYPVGSTVTATCLSGYLLPGGAQEYQVECTDSGWNVTFTRNKKLSKHASWITNKDEAHIEKISHKPGEVKARELLSSSYTPDLT